MFVSLYYHRYRQFADRSVRWRHLSCLLRILILSLPLGLLACSPALKGADAGFLILDHIMAESVISQGEQGTSAGPVGSPAPVGKKIYITANTFYGSMNAPGGGKAAADANCMADVN